MMKQILRSVIPSRSYKWLAMQMHRRYCPCCEQGSHRFEPFGSPVRNEAKCCICGALERHRLITQFMQRRGLLNDPLIKVLHMAPELSLSRLFEARASMRYVTADLDADRAMVAADLTQLPFSDGEFDAILCNHVLEHIPDDRQAMRELCRVLSFGGWAILQVPIRGDETYEDFSINDPEERKMHFGQHDHVRWYGMDYVDRLVDAGFDVEVVPSTAVCTPAKLRKLGIAPGELIFFCRKSPATTN